MQDLFRDLGAFTVATALSFGLGLQNGPPPRGPAPSHTRRATAPVPAVAPTPRHVAAPHRSVSWMDYIDFRRGSGDVLRRIVPTSLTDESSHPDHPHTCGAGE